MVQFTKKEEVVKVVIPATYTLELNEKEYAVLAGLVGAATGYGELRDITNELWDNAGMRKYFVDHGKKSLYDSISPLYDDFPEGFFND